MRRVLIVKTSSLGDIVHALPAVTDLLSVEPTAHVEWVAESPFADIPLLHPGVKRVITSDLRKWRKAPLSTDVRVAFGAFKAAMRETPYDCIVDLQGLVKSAAIARLAIGPRAGYDSSSAREPLASLSYQHKFAVSRAHHAVRRNRELMAAALGYTEPTTRSYGLRLLAKRERTIVLCHATSRENKLWPELYWRDLITQLEDFGYASALPWGTEEEHERAKRLVEGTELGVVWERMSVAELAREFGHVTAVIGVDTGLLHLAAAVGVPSVGIYTATDPGLAGAWGALAPAKNVGGKGLMPSPEDVLDIVVPWLEYSLSPR